MRDNVISAVYIMLYLINCTLPCFGVRDSYAALVRKDGGGSRVYQDRRRGVERGVRRGIPRAVRAAAKVQPALYADTAAGYVP